MVKGEGRIVKKEKSSWTSQAAKPSEMVKRRRTHRDVGPPLYVRCEINRILFCNVLTYLYLCRIIGDFACLSMQHKGK